MSEKSIVRVSEFLKRNCALVVLLCVGVGMLLLPEKSHEADGAQLPLTEAEIRLSGALSRTEGVGEVYVLLAEKPGREEGFLGAVVICTGAADAAVRLRIVEAVNAFTGLPSNHIVVQKMVS